MKLLSRSKLLNKLRSGTLMILMVGKSFVKLQNPQLFSVICGKLVTILTSSYKKMAEQLDWDITLML